MVEGWIKDIYIPYSELPQKYRLDINPISLLPRHLHIKRNRKMLGEGRKNKKIKNERKKI